MRTFEQLTAGEQEAAENRAASDLLQAICDGAVRFNDELNKDDLQARVDAAFARAEKMQTPWFAHEYIMDTCRDEIEGMARADAEDAMYPGADERTIRLS